MDTKFLQAFRMPFGSEIAYEKPQQAVRLFLPKTGGLPGMRDSGSTFSVSIWKSAPSSTRGCARSTTSRNASAAGTTSWRSRHHRWCFRPTTVAQRTEAVAQHQSGGRLDRFLRHAHQRSDSSSLRAQKMQRNGQHAHQQRLREHPQGAADARSGFGRAHLDIAAIHGLPPGYVLAP